jgi:hypothetical protein
MNAIKSSGKKYVSPTWTSQNRFHFDIDEDEDDERVEEVRFHKQNPIVTQRFCHSLPSCLVGLRFVSVESD